MGADCGAKAAGGGAKEGGGAGGGGGGASPKDCAAGGSAAIGAKPPAIGAWPAAGWWCMGCTGAAWAAGGAWGIGGGLAGPPRDISCRIGEVAGPAACGGGDGGIGGGAAGAATAGSAWKTSFAGRGIFTSRRAEDRTLRKPMSVTPSTSVPSATAPGDCARTAADTEVVIHVGTIAGSKPSSELLKPLIKVASDSFAGPPAAGACCCGAGIAGCCICGW